MSSTLNDVRNAEASLSAGDLVELLGDTRARLVHLLHGSAASVAGLAGEMGLSEVAVRRHLQVLERNGLVSAHTVRNDRPGRPSAHYALTDKARRLFPDNSAELAGELMDFLTDEHGRAELLRFLRWRAEHQAQRYAPALAGSGTVADRTEVLAQLLSRDGFDADVTAVTAPDGSTTLQLVQGHCALEAVAEEHPELCAFEASLFKQLLGGAKLSRRQTIAGGASACVCHIRTDDACPPNRSQ